MIRIFAFGRTRGVTSEDVAAYLVRDPTSIWADYNHGGPITQRQVAHLLDPYEIDPKPLHPTGRKDLGRMGYTEDQFVDAFARYLPGDLIFQSSGEKSSSHKQKRVKKRAKLRSKR